MIRLDGVAKAFGSFRVLRDFSLEVETGETVVVVGRSGAGKSVLLKLVAGLLQPDAGTVEVGGDSISGASPREVHAIRLRMGYVFQSSALFDSMTVAENIRLALWRHGVPEEEVEDRVKHSLSVVGLEDWGDRMPSELSGGMKKRAGVARAVAPSPAYLLYDEPTSGLDPVTTSMIDELILKLKDELGSTSLVVTHDMESAYRIADRMALLHSGSVQWTGTPEAFREEDDGAIRAFVEGRRDLWPEEDVA